MHRLGSDDMYLSPDVVTVRLVDDALDNRYLGMSTGWKNSIVLVKDQPASTLGKTLWHEIAHDFRDKRLGSIVQVEREEEFCDAFADYMTTFFTHNPDWVKWFLRITAKHNRRTGDGGQSARRQYNPGDETRKPGTGRGNRR